MDTDMRHYLIIIIGLLTLLATSLPSRGQQIGEYTEERPLIIVCDWEFPPYEFANNQGEADGFDVEVLDLILNRLEIPHRFVMKEWYQCTEMFDKREADLIHALTSNYMRKPYVMTRNLIHYYKVKAARHVRTKPLTRLGQLTETDTVLIKKNDYAALRIESLDSLPCIFEYHSTREALTGIQSGKYKYFIWGENPMEMKIREMHLDSIELDEIDIPAGELRIIGYDKDLIDLIDDQYARLEQAGQIEPISNKWFHPERVKNETSPLVLFIIIGAVIVVVIAFLLSRLIHARLLIAVRRSVDLNTMMTQAVSMGDYHVTDYDLQTGRMTNVYGNLLPEGGMPAEEFANRVHPDDRQEFTATIERMAKEGDTGIMKNRWNIGTAERPDWRYLYGDIIAEKENGKPVHIVMAVKDITRENDEERQNSEMSEKYRKIFDTNLLAMSFYSREGNLMDLNQKMRELCNFDDAGEAFFRKLNMFDTPFFQSDFDPTSHDIFHVCHHMYYPEAGVNNYIDFNLKPIIDENNEISYYAVTARNITDERRLYLDQREHDREMHRINDEANRYESQLHYLLENSDMYVWRSDFKKGVISFSRSLRQQDQVLTIPEYVSRMANTDQQASQDALDNDYIMSHPFDVIHYFDKAPYIDQPAWIAISGTPIFDSDGKVLGQFGIMRNVTKLIETQEKLKQERLRAEDSGRLKSVFLANMTHEIRTPLNAIVGFSDLLPLVDTAEERMEFIRIIRNNCDMLLRLINDILEASSMGQALSIEPMQVDFAQVFDDICQTLAQRVQEPGVAFVKDNPYKHFVTVLDKGRVQQVLTNFTTNAVKYTHDGHIKVGYRYQQEGIYLYCEDTGAGIPKDKQASVFERFVKLNDFVQGTGLGLSICKSIAERCGGKIGVFSEGEGYGSTFWMWIPVEVIEEIEAEAKS